MNIPSLIHLSDQELHPKVKDVLWLVLDQLQKNLSNEGYKVPQQPTNTINTLNTMQSIGALLYDNQTHELKVNINGTFKTVQVA